MTEIISTKAIGTDIKTSFDPISDRNTSILILGTMPGDKSLELGEYYGHARNRFWRIISEITKEELPSLYDDKKRMLLKSTIGLWDVARKATRKGSLDAAIKGEEPNDLEPFLVKHPNIKVIGFNGQKAEKLYDKYFVRKNGIKYICLPSTSPANAAIDFESACSRWSQLFE